MGTTPEQARAQVGATRARLDSTLDRLELRLRQELDPRRRLRRDGAKLAVGAAVVALVGTAYIVKSRRRRRQEPEPGDWIESMPAAWRERLSELLAEAAASKHRLPGGRDRRQPSSMARRIAMRAGRMAAPIVLNAVGERVAARQRGQELY